MEDWLTDRTYVSSCKVWHRLGLRKSPNYKARLTTKFISGKRWGWKTNGMDSFLSANCLLLLLLLLFYPNLFFILFFAPFALPYVRMPIRLILLSTQLALRTNGCSKLRRNFRCILLLCTEYDVLLSEFRQWYAQPRIPMLALLSWSFRRICLSSPIAYTIPEYSIQPSQFRH